MYELIIDTEARETIHICTTYEEVEMIIEMLKEEGHAVWEVRSYPDCGAIAEGQTW